MENLEALRKHKLPRAVGMVAGALLAMDPSTAAQEPAQAEPTVASYLLPPPRIMETGSLSDEQDDWQALRASRAARWASHTAVQRTTQTSRSETRHSPPAPHAIDGYWFGLTSTFKRLGAEGQRNAQLLYQLGTDYHLSTAAIGCLDNVGSMESSFRVKALNPNSKTYGVPQAQGSMAAAGPNYLTDAETQERWFMGYTGEIVIKGVNSHYPSACNAWAFWQANNWY